VLTLAINLFLKIMAPILLDLTLSRTMETVVGQSIPLICLLGFELYYYFHKRVAPVQSVNMHLETLILPVEMETEARQQNSFGIRVIGISMALVGTGILLLGFFSGNSNVVVIVGSIILLIAMFIYRKGNKPVLNASYNTIKNH
jgi:hypothetical protein